MQLAYPNSFDWLYGAPIYTTRVGAKENGYSFPSFFHSCIAASFASFPFASYVGATRVGLLEGTKGKKKGGRSPGLGFFRFEGRSPPDKKSIESDTQDTEREGDKIMGTETKRVVLNFQQFVPRHHGSMKHRSRLRSPAP